MSACHLSCGDHAGFINLAQARDIFSDRACKQLDTLGQIADVLAKPVLVSVMIGRAVDADRAFSQRPLAGRAHAPGWTCHLRSPDNVARLSPALSEKLTPVPPRE
ncbi:hypothetical protein ACVWZW_003592 [Bradyrhizobium sp. F1.13.4]